jgi:hypothetical protein
MTDMTRTLKLINDCDEEVHFERQVKRELLRLHDLLGKANALANIRATRIAELEAQLYAVGAGGVGPLMPVVEHPDNETVPVPRQLADLAIREIARYCNTGEMDDAESLLAALSFSIDQDQQLPAPQAVDTKPVTLHLTMCADQHCPEYGTCYRAQAKPAPDQRFWAVSPREDNSCRFYAPMYFTNGLSALQEDAQ